MRAVAAGLARFPDLDRADVQDSASNDPRRDSTQATEACFTPAGSSGCKAEIRASPGYSGKGARVTISQPVVPG